MDFEPELQPDAETADAGEFCFEKDAESIQLMMARYVMVLHKLNLVPQQQHPEFFRLQQDFDAPPEACSLIYTVSKHIASFVCKCAED